MEPNEKPRRRMLVVLGVVVVVAVAVIAALVWPRGDDGQEDAAPSVQPGEDLEVVAGSGGGELAPDGQTPVGYEPTCQGAVQAATNYATLLSQADLDLPDGTEETVRSVLLDDSAADESMRVMKNEVIANSLSSEEIKQMPDMYDSRFHPEWSGKYHVAECVEGETATVGVSGVLTTQLPSDEANSEYTGRVFELVWADDDWKIQNEVTAEDDGASIIAPALAETPEMTTGETTRVQWKDGEPETVTEDEDRVVLDSAALADAFGSASPGVDEWVSFQEGSE